MGDNLGWIPVRTDLSDYTLADGTPLSDITMIARDVTWVNEQKNMILDKFAEIRD